MTEGRGVTDIAYVETVGQGDSRPGLELVQQHLLRYGYLKEEPSTPGLLDEATSRALQDYQEFFGIEISGTFDVETREQMTRPRCGMPDRLGSPFITTCAWPKRNLTYAWAGGTEDTYGEFTAVERAMATWSAVVALTFTRVNGRLNTTADIKISWVDALHDEDATPGSTVTWTFGPQDVAHADSPPNCSTFGPATAGLPRPLHFNDEVFVFDARDPIHHRRHDVETVALHELGHLIGLGHSTTPGAVMFPTLPLGTVRRALTADDIAGARSLYP